MAGISAISPEAVWDVTIHWPSPTHLDSQSIRQKRKKKGTQHSKPILNQLLSHEFYKYYFFLIRTLLFLNFYLFIIFWRLFTLQYCIGFAIHWHDSFKVDITIYSWTSLVAQMVKCLPTMWEIWVQSLCQEDPLEKEMATHSRILAWKIPWMEEPGRLQSMGLQLLFLFCRTSN